MSLRHLYLDLNYLGVYPDLILQTFMEPSGDIDEYDTEIIRPVMILNKYYGRKVYNHRTVRIRKMYSKATPEANMVQIDERLDHKYDLTIIIQGTDTFTIGWTYPKMLLSHNSITREIPYILGDCPGDLLLMNMRDVKDLDGLEEAIEMSMI